MRKEDVVDLLGFEREIRAVAIFNLVRALKQSAIKEDLKSLCFHEMTRTRNRFRRTAKSDLHYLRSFTWMKQFHATTARQAAQHANRVVALCRFKWVTGDNRASAKTPTESTVSPRRARRALARCSSRFCLLHPPRSQRTKRLIPSLSFVTLKLIRSPIFTLASRI